MSPFELRRLREVLGLSLNQMASKLSLSGENAHDAVRKMELGNKPITAPIATIAHNIALGTSMGVADGIPKFTVGDDLSGESKIELIHHNHHPRALFCVLDKDSDAPNMTLDNIEYVTLVCNYEHMTEAELNELLEQACTYLRKYNELA